MKRLSTLALSAALFAASFAAQAQTTPAAKPATATPTSKPATATPAPKQAAKPAPAKAAPEPAAASPAQLAAAERVFYGTYVCEFNKTVQVATMPKYPGYAELRFDKSVYIMKPVHSETGAIRLEDVKGETLVIQIAAKSMLLNVKTGQRLLDGCVNEKQGKVASTS